MMIRLKTDAEFLRLVATTFKEGTDTHGRVMAIAARVEGSPRAVAYGPWKVASGGPLERGPRFTVYRVPLDGSKPWETLRDGQGRARTFCTASEAHGVALTLNMTKPAVSPTSPQERVADALETLCRGLRWNIEHHPTVMNQSDEEALAQGLEALRGIGREP